MDLRTTTSFHHHATSPSGEAACCLPLGSAVYACLVCTMAFLSPSMYFARAILYAAMSEGCKHGYVGRI